VGSAGLLALHFFGWVRLWEPAIVLWGACLAWALQLYLDLHAGVPASGDREARLRFARALFVSIVWPIAVVTWFLTGS
jgi:hypothetical protein